MGKGIPEIIKNHQNGILVTPESRNEISNAIRFFIEHPENIQNYGNKSFEIVQSYFPEQVIKQLESIYTKLLS